MNVSKWKTFPTLWVYFIKCLSFNIALKISFASHKKFKFDFDNITAAFIEINIIHRIFRIILRVLISFEYLTTISYACNVTVL